MMRKKMNPCLIQDIIDRMFYSWNECDSDNECLEFNYYNEIEDDIIAMCKTPNCCFEELENLLDEGCYHIFPHDEYIPILTACKYKNFQLIKWFMSTYQYANHVIYQKIVYKTLQFDVAQWFRETYHIRPSSVAVPVHFFENDWKKTVKENHEICEMVQNGTAVKIRTKKEQIWYRRKYALWLSSSISPNKESIFYCIPKEISRYIVECYL
jgi:hypothetical protein